MNKTRYSRQIILEQIGLQGQQKLSQSKVAIIGSGALGTPVANNLARAGVGHLLLVDRDLVELSNLQRQLLFDEESLGKPKAMVAAEKLKRINSEVDIQFLIKDVNNTNIEEMLTGYDLVMDCTDNVPIRMLINDVCVKNKIPWIYTGVIRTRGMLMPVLPGGPCFRCLMPDLPPPGAVQTCETAGILNTVPTILASIQCTEAYKILLGHEVVPRLIVYDVWEHSFKLLEVGKSDKCQCCGKADYRFLESEKRELITSLCDRGVQIIPAEDMKLDMKRIATNLEKMSAKVMFSPFLIKFHVEGVQVNLFKDGRALIRGIGDFGAAKSFYSRYLGL